VRPNDFDTPPTSAPWRPRQVTAAKWTQAHHIVEWFLGGPTALHNLTLVCRYHHQLIYHSPWQVRLTQGFPEYIPPSSVDPQRKPRRNTLHATRT
jgi:hypothetical protein